MSDEENVWTIRINKDAVGALFTGLGLVFFLMAMVYFFLEYQTIHWQAQQWRECVFMGLCGGIC